MFSTPFVVLAKLEENEAKATYWPVSLMLGNSLAPFPGTPGVVTETKLVEGVHPVTIAMQASRK
jgi:hypothetical protein